MDLSKTPINDNSVQEDYGYHRNFCPKSGWLSNKLKPIHDELLTLLPEADDPVCSKQFIHLLLCHPVWNESGR